METAAARSALDRVLVGQLASAVPADDAIVAAVDRLAGAEALPPVARMASELGISPRQLQRRFRAAVGLSPKEFVRVLRFARVWQVASMRPDESWAKLAADFGYSDQAHLVREFRDFGAEPPSRVFTPDWYNATAFSRVSGPAGGVRSVQDPGSKPRV